MGSGLRVHAYLEAHPLATANRVGEQTGLSAPTVNLALGDLERLGIVAEISGRRRGRVLGIVRIWIFEGNDTALGPGCAGPGTNNSKDEYRCLQRDWAGYGAPGGGGGREGCAGRAE